MTEVKIDDQRRKSDHPYLQSRVALHTTLAPFLYLCSSVFICGKLSIFRSQTNKRQT